MKISAIMHLPLKLSCMKLFLSAAALALTLTVLSFSKPHSAKTPKPGSHKIQVAILLDVSNSMDGLIEQAKAQLWNMVTTLGRTTCNDQTVPQVEVALYE